MDRKQYIAGLKELADLLETNDDLPVPTHGEIKWLLFSMTDDPATYAKQKRTAALIVRRLGGADKSDVGDLFALEHHLGGPDGLKCGVTVNRASVCERVVTGTREVTTMVPDPKVSVPMVEVTETVEDVRWQCAPLLAGADS